MRALELLANVSVHNMVYNIYPDTRPPLTHAPPPPPQVSPAVMDFLLPQRPELKPWVELVRARRRRGSSTTLGGMTGAGGLPPGLPGGPSRAGGAGAPTPPPGVAIGLGSSGDMREQTHVLPLYGMLCECIACSDPRVREVVKQLLQAVGRELGLINVLGVPVPSSAAAAAAAAIAAS